LHQLNATECIRCTNAKPFSSYDELTGPAIRTLTFRIQAGFFDYAIDDMAIWMFYRNKALCFSLNIS